MNYIVAFLMGVLIFIFWTQDPQHAMWAAKLPDRFVDFLDFCVQYKLVASIVAFVIGLAAIMTKRQL
jgi:hypothetical protein